MFQTKLINGIETLIFLFADILRKSDDSVFAGWSTKTRTEHNFAGSDFVRADCEAQDAAS